MYCSTSTNFDRLQQPVARIKKSNFFYLLFVIFCYFLTGVQTAIAQPFTHPGLLHKQSDLDRMKAKVDAGLQPWKGSWDVLVANSHSSLTRAFTNPIPSIVYRGFDGTHAENYATLFRDAASAYATALRWKISGDNAYADKSIAILNAWAAGLTTISGTSDKYLLAGIQGYQLANAAEIMRSYSGWAPADFTAFKNWMLNIFYSMNHDFLVNHNGACISNYYANWDLCNMASMLSIGVLCDRRDLYNEAVDYFKFGAGNGQITKLVPYLYGDLGQWQESGRDQPHTVLGVALAGSFAEMAWNQGDDLYGYDNSRLLKGFEYIAKYNLGYSVPYTTYSNCIGVVQTIISADGRGDLRPVWEMVYNHYVNRKGLSAPYISLWAQRVRPEGGGGNYGPNSGGYDQIGYGTLTATLETTAKPNNQSITFPAIPAKNYNDPDFSPGATASSGLAIVYSVADPTVASVNADGTIHILKPGTTVIYAQQLGDATYNEAPVAQQTLTVNQIPGTTNGTWSNTAGIVSTAISSTSGSPNLTWSGQTFAVGDLVRLVAPVPGGFISGTSYNVVAVSGSPASTFQLALQPGGTPINATSTITNGGGQRFLKWLNSAYWTGGIVPSGVHSTATFGATSFGNIGGVTLDANITIGNLVYAANGTGELTLASGLNNGKLTFATISGTPTLTMINTGSRKLFMGNANNNARVPLKFAGTQGLKINTPVYGGGNPAGLRIQAAMDWSEFSGGLTLAQGTIELHNTTNSPTGADNVLLPPQRLKMATENIAVIYFTGSSTAASKQTIGALDGTSDAYIFARNSLTNGAPTLVVGADNGDGNFEGTIGGTPVDQAIDRGRINLEKIGTGTQTISGVIKNGTTVISGSNVYSAVTVNNGKLVLTGANEYQGATTVTGGTLVINGSVVSPVSVNTGFFEGNGSSTANITVGTGSGAGAMLAPGNSIGTFTTTGTLTLQSDATYTLEFNSNLKTFDKIVAGTVNLNNAKLTLTDLGANAIMSGESYVIIDNTGSAPVVGTFKDLSEGAVITIGANSFAITYVGGNGNDVVLNVLKHDQTITFNSLGDKMFGDADFDPGATASSGLAITYSSSNEAVATIINGKIHIVNAGITNITASQPGDNTYNAATPQIRVLTVNKLYYVDADNDGFGSTASALFPSVVAPAGYVENNSDCDDSKLLYADNDGDGFGAGAPTACGVANNTDCDDTNPLQLSATIPDAYAMDPTKDNKNTIYIGYGPGTLTLNVNVSGGTAPYTYQWSNGASGQSITVSAAGTYTVIVTDAHNCTMSASIRILTLDVTCGSLSNKVMVCHNGSIICIASASVEAHLNHGDHLGSCTPSTLASVTSAYEEVAGYQVRTYPNPVAHTLNIQVSSVQAGAMVQVYNANGAVVLTQRLTNTVQSLSVSRLTPGIYYVKVINGSKITTEKIVKQ